MPSRRTLLTSLGAALTGLAGCLETSSDGTPTATQADAGDVVTVDGVSVTVADPVVAHSVRYLTAPDALGVADAGSDQFVLARASAQGDGTPPASDGFAVAAGENTYDDRLDSVGPARIGGPLSGRRYEAESPNGYLGFRVPAPLDVADAAVVLGDAARWTLPDSVLDALGSPPPEFETAVTVPDHVPADEPIPVQLAVTNTGGGGIFRGAINHQGPLYAPEVVTIPLPAGESTTRELLIDYYRDDELPPDRVQFGVVGPGFSRSFTVRLDGDMQTDSTPTVTETPYSR